MWKVVESFPCPSTVLVDSGITHDQMSVPDWAVYNLHMVREACSAPLVSSSHQHTKDNEGNQYFQFIGRHICHHFINIQRITGGSNIDSILDPKFHLEINIQRLTRELNIENMFYPGLSPFRHCTMVRDWSNIENFQQFWKNPSKQS